MPNFVSFAALSAELAHGEKSHTHSHTHPAYLMPWEQKLLLRNKSFQAIDCTDTDNKLTMTKRKQETETEKTNANTNLL